MNIKILYDNHAPDNSFAAGWGFSCVVDDTVLFDTGENGESLLQNMVRMGVVPQQINDIVISHEHWDHVDGLWQVLAQKRGIIVHVCQHISATLRNEINKYGGMVVDSAICKQIKEHIFVTGEIMCTYKNRPMPEQALIIEGARGVSVITGCSHPGIVQILRLVKEKYPQTPIDLVLGGFHLKDSDETEIADIVKQFKSLGVLRVGATHCSGTLAAELFKNEYATHAYDITIGDDICV